MPGENIDALAWAAGRILYSSRLLLPTFHYCSPRREDLFPLRYHNPIFSYRYRHLPNRSLSPCLMLDSASDAAGVHLPVYHTPAAASLLHDTITSSTGSRGSNGSTGGIRGGRSASTSSLLLLVSVLPSSPAPLFLFLLRRTGSVNPLPSCLRR